MKTSSLFHFHKQDNADIKKVLEKQTNEIAKLKVAINNFWFEVPVEPEEQQNFQVKTQEKVPESPKIRVSFQIPNSSEENRLNKKSFWIEDIKKEFTTDALGDGEERKLKDKELIFWDELIAKYLEPLTQTKEDKANVANDLKELRNGMTFSFLIINIMFVLLLMMLQSTTDVLYITWPVPSKVCRY